MDTQYGVAGPGTFEVNAGNSSFREIISVLAEEDCAKQSTLWNRVLGLVAIVLISTGGWTAIIALASLLR
jgi:hypothetical protein